MKRINLLALLLFSGVFSLIHAQSEPEGCGYDHYVQSLEQQHPGFREAMERAWPRRSESGARDLEVYTIPVVVHVVYQDEQQNLSDSLVADVIKGLNEDYRRLNADAENVRDTFADRVGDAFIEFELVTTERVLTAATFELDIQSGSLPDNVKQSIEGGSDAWPTDQYLNIWVCNIDGGSLLGYAYPPADLDHWPGGTNAPDPALDGVVIHYEAFRRSGEFTATGLIGGGEITIPIRGRSVTHEVGHYLGLRHIWGDGFLSLLGIPDCQADDGVSDTPNQGLGSQFGCNFEQNTCEEAEGPDYPDMIENFMDYSTEDCQNSFTHGQIAIMRGVLENQRSGLLGDVVSTQSPALVGGGLYAYPNPATDELRLEITDSNARGPVVIRNAHGQVIRQVTLAPGSRRLSLPVRNWPRGWYTVQRAGAGAIRILVQ